MRNGKGKLKGQWTLLKRNMERNRGPFGEVNRPKPLWAYLIKALPSQRGIDQIKRSLSLPQRRKRSSRFLSPQRSSAFSAHAGKQRHPLSQRSREATKQQIISPSLCTTGAKHSLHPRRAGAKECEFLSAQKFNAANRFPFSLSNAAIKCKATTHSCLSYRATQHKGT